jgi:hypothetical protein
MAVAGFQDGGQAATIQYISESYSYLIPCVTPSQCEASRDTPHRSFRLAAKLRAMPMSSMKRVQRVLLGKSGIAPPEVEITKEHLAEYAGYFTGRP